MYKITSGNTVIDLSYGDGTSRFVPIDHEEYKQWIAEGNTPESEFTDEELLKQKQDKFRLERNALLDKVDIEINKAEDLEQDSKVLRVYRQKLRDSTINWVMPESMI